MQTLWRLFYDLLWGLFFPFWLLAKIWQYLKNPTEAKISWKDRLAKYSVDPWSQRPVVWFHGSSLGEVLSLIPLMKELQKRWGNSQILTVSTSRGYYIACEKKVPAFLAYIPLDVSFLVRRAIKKLHPDILIVFETEIWPNLFWECYKQNIPVVVVSGRISPKSFSRYRHVRFFFKSVLSQAIFLMQSPEDAQRIQSMGAPSERIYCTGDIKLDGLKTNLNQEEREFLQKYFNIKYPVIVMGSTHPGEEELILDIFQKFLQENILVTLIIAPRHLNRMPDILSLFQQKKIGYILRSKMTEESLQDIGQKIILLDTYGELSKVYDLANIVIMGGTFAPVGGHNLMEAAALAKPVIFGPNISNCRQQAKLLLEKNAGIQVDSQNELQQILKDLLSHPQQTKEMGRRGQNVVLSNQGAMQRCLEKLEQISKKIMTML